MRLLSRRGRGLGHLLLLAPMIQELIVAMEITAGRDSVSERGLRAVVAEADWDRQRSQWKEILEASRAKRAANGGDDASSARIEGRDFTLFKDYDRSYLPGLTFRGKVRWFDERTRLVLVRPLEVLRPRRRGPAHPRRASFKLIFGAALFSGVEALGGFYRGRDGSGQTFRAFVRDFMDPVYRPYVGALRDDFRNGLADGLTVKRGGFEFIQGAPLRAAHGIEIDPDFLLRDFKRARREYVRQVRSGGPASAIGQAFAKRFAEVYEN